MQNFYAFFPGQPHQNITYFRIGSDCIPEGKNNNLKYFTSHLRDYFYTILGHNMREYFVI